MNDYIFERVAALAPQPGEKIALAFPSGTTEESMGGIVARLNAAYPLSTVFKLVGAPPWLAPAFVVADITCTDGRVTITKRDGSREQHGS